MPEHCCMLSWRESNIFRVLLWIHCPARPSGTPSWSTPQRLSDGDGIVISISCPTSSYCGAVETTPYTGDFLYDSVSGGTWTQPGTLPSFGYGTYYSSVSCQPNSTSATCVVVGYCSCNTYPDAVGITSTNAGSTWAGGPEENVPSNQDYELSQVSCPTAT